MMNDWIYYSQCAQVENYRYVFVSLSTLQCNIKPSEDTLYGQMFVDKVGNTQLYTMSLGMMRHYSFSLMQQRGSTLFLHDSDPVHKASSLKTWCPKVGVEECERPAQSPNFNPTEHLWDKLMFVYLTQHQCHTQIPTDVLENLVGSLPRRAEDIIKVKEETAPGSRSFCPCCAS